MTKPDTRSIRDICLDIAKRVRSTGGPKKPMKTFPSRLSQKAVDALEMVLQDCVKPIKFSDLVDAMNDLEPGCVYKGGEVNASIKQHVAEMQGIAVMWAIRRVAPADQREEE